MLTIANHYDTICVALCLSNGSERAKREGKVKGWIVAALPGGWVRKDQSPTGSVCGSGGGKPPSPDCLPPFVFGLGIPLIPFLRLYKDTKCIVKIIIIRGEMRFVHR